MFKSDFQYNTSYTFKQPMTLVFNSLKDPYMMSHFFSKVGLSIFAEPSKVTSAINYEIDHVFKIHCGSLCFLFTIIDLVTTDYFCRVHYDVKIEGHSINKKMFSIINLHKISDKKTLLICVFKGHEDKIQQRSISPKKSAYMNFFKGLDRCLWKTSKIQSQTDSKIISAKFLKAKEYFMNARVCTGLMGEIISCTDTIIKKGSIVVFKAETNEKRIIQVRKLKLKPNSLLTSFMIYDHISNGLPRSEFIVELYSVNEDETFVVFRHNFYKFLSDEAMESLHHVKRKVLKKLSLIIEKSVK